MNPVRAADFCNFGQYDNGEGHPSPFFFAAVFVRSVFVEHSGLIRSGFSPTAVVTTTIDPLMFPLIFHVIVAFAFSFHHPFAFSFHYPFMFTFMSTFMFTFMSAIAHMFAAVKIPATEVVTRALSIVVKMAIPVIVSMQPSLSLPSLQTLLSLDLLRTPALVSFPVHFTVVVAVIPISVAITMVRRVADTQDSSSQLQPFIVFLPVIRMDRQ